MQFIFWSLDQSSLDVNQIWPDLKHYTVWNFLHQPVSGTQSSHTHRHMHTQRYKQVSCSGSIPLLISFLVSFYCYHGNNGFRLCVFAWTQLWCISACLLFFCVFLIITLSYAHTHTQELTSIDSHAAHWSCFSCLQCTCLGILLHAHFLDVVSAF